MAIYRYSRWDGSQDVAFPSTEDLFDKLSEQILQGDDLRGALRRMMQHGIERPQGQRGMGMQDLLQRLRDAKERNLERYNLSSMFEDIEQRISDIIEKERQGIDERLQSLQPPSDQASDQASNQGDQDGDAAADGDGSADGSGNAGDGDASEFGDMLRQMASRHLDQLDGLPSGAGGRIKQLRDYDFMNPDARQDFDALMEELQQQVLQQYFQGLQQSLQGMSQEDLSQIAEMVRDLNELVKQRLQGDDPDISDFMNKWGQMFPPGIETFDQLMDYMSKQMAQMQSLLNSMPPEMRRQLEEMMEGLLQDNRLSWDLFELGTNLERLNPDGFQDNGFRMFGDEPVTLQQALELMGDLNGMEEMESQLRQALRTNDPSQVDADELGRVLGEEARQYAQELQRLTKELEDAGLIRRRGQGWELTPQAMRKIGDKALTDIFQRIRGGGIGDHNREKSGIGVEITDETKLWEFGDPLHLNTLKTVSNAVLREGPGTPVRIRPDDFEVDRTISQTRASTIIAIDMSYSMFWDGAFQAGQRVGLALDTLIKTKFPKDQVSVVAFSYFVLPIKSDMLLETYWVEFGGGTNFQEVLRQSRQMLARQGGNNKQIILITDGEPTTYNWQEDDLQASFGRGGRHGRGGGSGLLEATMREVMRCTRDNITINTFMLDQSPSLLRFVQLMTKMNKGRAFVASPDNLGSYVVSDYVSNRTKVIR